MATDLVGYSISVDYVMLSARGASMSRIPGAPRRRLLCTWPRERESRRRERQVGSGLGGRAEEPIRRSGSPDRRSGGGPAARDRLVGGGREPGRGSADPWPPRR